jgi:hypothetical protein
MVNTKSALLGLTHTKKRMLKDAKYRAAKRNIPFNLTIDDIDVPLRCPVLGFVLRRRNPERAPSLDRIIPDLGYVRGNVIVVSALANRIKSDAAINQIRLVADFYETLLRNFHDT